MAASTWSPSFKKIEVTPKIEAKTSGNNENEPNPNPSKKKHKSKDGNGNAVKNTSQPDEFKMDNFPGSYYLSSPSLGQKKK